MTCLQEEVMGMGKVCRRSSESLGIFCWAVMLFAAAGSAFHGDDRSGAGRLTSTGFRTVGGQDIITTRTGKMAKGWKSQWRERNIS